MPVEKLLPSQAKRNVVDPPEAARGTSGDSQIHSK
jgi:hypothetical protein